VQRLYPPHEAGESGPGPDAPHPYASLNLPEGPPDRPYVVVNMVSTVDGKIALGGRVRGLGSRVDRRAMRLLRAQVDAVLIGAGTVRAEVVDMRTDDDLAAAREARGEALHPLAVTVSRSLDLDPRDRFFRGGPERSLILTTASSATERGERFAGVAQLLTTEGDDVDLAAAFAELRQRRGVRRLLCEGGPTLNQRLLDLGLLDELFWTIAPMLAGGSSPGLLESPEPPDRIRSGVRLMSMYEQEGELFTRYRIVPPPS